MGGETPFVTPTEIIIRQGSSMDTKTTKRKNVEKKHILTGPKDHSADYTFIAKGEMCLQW